MGKNYYLTSYNDEYASIAIIAGPGTKEEMVKEMREYTAGRIAELGIAVSFEGALQLYDIYKKHCSDYLLVEDNRAVLYWDDVREDIQIIEYNGKEP